MSSSNHLAKLLGFRTARALQFCQAATNHHKSWQILLVLLNALSDELLFPSVHFSLQTSSPCTAQGFLSWINSVRNPNYLFLFQFTFTYLVSLYLFRCSVLCPTKQLRLLAPRITFSPLYHMLNIWPSIIGTLSSETWPCEHNAHLKWTNFLEKINRFH